MLLGQFWDVGALGRLLGMPSQGNGTMARTGVLKVQTLECSWLQGRA